MIEPCKSLLLLLAALVATTLAGPAQNPTSPSTLEHQEGPGGDDYPLGVPAIRYQQIHDDLPGMALIDGLSFRRDGLRTTTMNAWDVELELWLSTTTLAARDMGITFAANRGGDHTQVMTRRWVNLPPLPLDPARPQPFTVHLLCDQPFPYLGSGNLLWEMVVHHNRQGSLLDQKVFNFLDAQAPTLAKGDRLQYGQGCMGSNQAVPTLDSWMRNDGFFRATVGNAPAGVAGLATYGDSDAKFFFFNLPYDLTPLGAPGCQVLCNHAITFPFITDPFGTALVQVGGITITTPMEGVEVFGQAFLLDAGANATGLTVTQGIKLTIPPALASGKGVSRLYSLGDTTALVGTLNQGYGLVVRLRTR